MFKDAASFNADFSEWDVAEGEGFGSMFEGATSFNADLSKWNVGKGKGFVSMFNGASEFNADLSKWMIRNGGGEFGSMFNGATSFNADLSEWKKRLYNVDNWKDSVRGARPHSSTVALCRHDRLASPRCVCLSSRTPAARLPTAACLASSTATSRR